MRSFAFILIASISFSSWSMSIRNCEISAFDRNGDNSRPWKKQIFLSRDFTNRVEFSNTVLDLRLDSELRIKGLVNNQPNFILRGNASEGSFESSFHTGTIVCGPSLEVTHLFQHKPWKQFFSTDLTINAGHILQSIGLASIKYGHVCFIGDVKDVEAEASAFLNLKGIVKSQYEIQYSWDDVECVRGTGSFDSWKCEETKIVRRTDSLRHCYLNGNERF